MQLVKTFWELKKHMDGIERGGSGGEVEVSIMPYYVYYTYKYIWLEHG